MTTIVYKDRVMVGDGQVTRYESLIESTSMIKVRNIGNALVGGAGDGISIMKFFDWFADKVESEWAQEEYQNLTILPPEDLVEENFQALVVSPDGQIFEYIGTKNIFPVTEPCAAIGSGCVYAYPLMDVGLTAREAVEGAIKRCPYSGGDITEITFEEEAKPLTREDMESMTKETIITELFGEPEEEVVVGQEPETVTQQSSYMISGSHIDVVHCERSLLIWVAKELKVKFAHNIRTEPLRKRVLDKLNKED